MRELLNYDQEGLGVESSLQAGGGLEPYSSGRWPDGGEGAPAILAQLGSPYSVAADNKHSLLYVAESENHKFSP